MFAALKTDSDDWLRLDMLRFVAAAGIVWHHSHAFYAPASQRAALMAGDMGWGLFVDLFFIISGFIISAVYSDRISAPRDIGRFFQRRVARLVPLHWLTLLLTLCLWQAIERLGLPADHPPDMSLACVANNAFLLNGIWQCGAVELSRVTWSISVEMVCYLLFPLLLVLRRFRGAIEAAFVLTFLVFVGELIGTDFLLVPRVLRGLPAFLFGAVLFHHRDRLAAVSYVGDRALLAAVAALMLTMAAKAPLLLTYAGVFLVGFLAIVGDVAKAGPARWILALAPWGSLTYSIYMWHWLIILAVMNGVADKLLHLSTLPMMGVGAACYAAILVWSYWSWVWYETPARKAIDSIGSFKRAEASSRS